MSVIYIFSLTEQQCKASGSNRPASPRQERRFQVNLIAETSSVKPGARNVKMVSTTALPRPLPASLVNDSSPAVEKFGNQQQARGLCPRRQVQDALRLSATPAVGAAQQPALPGLQRECAGAKMETGRPTQC